MRLIRILSTFLSPKSFFDLCKNQITTQEILFDTTSQPIDAEDRGDDKNYCRFCPHGRFTFYKNYFICWKCLVTSINSTYVHTWYIWSWLGLGQKIQNFYQGKYFHFQVSHKEFYPIANLTEIQLNSELNRPDIAISITVVSPPTKQSSPELAMYDGLRLFSNSL